jgi:GNAT superfamily N-acetyltransferase
MRNYINKATPQITLVENILETSPSQLNFENQSQGTEIISQADLQINEITKLAEKLKWNERFYKSYSGDKVKVSAEKVASCRFFLAIYKGKEAGYIRIFNYTNTFSEFYSGEVWAINEGYIKPTYRSKGLLTALRAYVVKNCSVKLMRIETHRYIKLQDYYAEQGFIYGYPILEGYLSTICVPEFEEALYAYANLHSTH